MKKDSLGFSLNDNYQGAWLAQLVEHLTPSWDRVGGWLSWLSQESCEPLTPDFGSGHDLRIMRSSPKSDFTLSRETAGDFSPFPCPCTPSPACKLPLKMNKSLKKLNTMTVETAE